MGRSHETHNPGIPLALSIADHLDIEMLYCRYNHLVDVARDAGGVAGCFTPNGSYDHWHLGRVEEAEALAAFMQRAIDEQSGAFQHWTGNLLLDEATDGSVVASAFVFTIDDRGAKPVIDGMSRYEDRLLRAADGWRLDSRRVLNRRNEAAQPVPEEGVAARNLARAREAFAYITRKACGNDDGKRSLDSFFSALADDIVVEYNFTPETPVYGQPRKGIAAVRQLRAAIEPQVFKQIVVESEPEFYSDGDRVILLFRYAYTIAATGERFGNTSVVYRMEFTDGLISHLLVIEDSVPWNKPATFANITEPS